MKTRLLIMLPVILLAGCRNKAEKADAYGNFEATEIIVSAETNGRILSFAKDEGAHIDQGEVIALIDTSILHLQKGEIDATMNSVRTRIAAINSQNDILNQQIANQNINVARFEKMLKDDAATQKQYDDLTGQVAVFRKQIAANNSQKASIASELGVSEARKATLNEQIAKSCVKSPTSGTIIEKYSEAGEMAAAGKPLIKIADLSVIKLKVYVSGADIGKIHTGQECKVRIDDGKKGFRNYTGVISWISDKAEFTPKIIQTKEERVTFVYAVKISINNDGSLKSGMPGEAIF